MSPKKIDFDEALLQAVDEGLSRSLGENVAKALLWHIRRITGLEREDIPHHLSTFNESLRHLLGEGAGLLERQMVQILSSHLNVKSEFLKVDNFVQQIEELRCILKERSSRGGRGPKEQP